MHIDPKGKPGSKITRRSMMLQLAGTVGAAALVKGCGRPDDYSDEDESIGSIEQAAAEDMIFWSPNPLQFPKPTAAQLAAGSAVQVVRFLNEAIAPTPWIVTDIVMPQFATFLDKTRWTFVNVTRESTNVMRANLRFNTIGFASSTLGEDVLLRMAWNGQVNRNAIFQIKFNLRGVTLPVIFGP